MENNIKQKQILTKKHTAVYAMQKSAMNKFYII